jgi:nucleoside-diphosphate-sugar epimerase
MRVFITGGTGYMGRPLTAALLGRGHSVCALVRPGSENNLPRGCDFIRGNALSADTYSAQMPRSDVFVHLCGVARPAPWKADAFRQVDKPSLEASVQAAKAQSVGRFVYVSVAQPAPVMRAYQQVRKECENLIFQSGLQSTILRPWYVLGPGHRWPLALVPFYKAAERLPATRSAAARLGLLRLNDMIRALVWAVESPGWATLDVPLIRAVASDMPPSAAGELQ